MAGGVLLATHGGVHAFVCHVEANGTQVTYVDQAVDVQLMVRLFCGRARTEHHTLSYRIKADWGGYPQAASPFRAVRLNATTPAMAYALNRGLVPGGGATCSGSTNWLAPGTGNTNVMSGSLNFGGTIGATAQWSYCLRVIGPAGSGSPMPAAGVYQDAFRVTVQYPGTDAGTLSAPVSVPVTVTVVPRCVLQTVAPLAFSYRSFEPADVLAGSLTSLTCSQGLPWTASIDNSSAELLGLRYTLATVPTAGTSTGTAQPVVVHGHMPPGQAGRCGAGRCSARRVHTLTIQY